METAPELPKLKLLIIGHGRHGKDTVCEMLRDNMGYTFESSSHFCCKHFIYDMLKPKYGYKDIEECYADRHNHRAEWYDAICAYNKTDAARLGRQMFAEYDIYCGLRNKREFFAMQNTGVYDFCIWIDRSDHLPSEGDDSMSLKQWMADFTIDNNGDLEELQFNTRNLMEQLHGGVSHLMKMNAPPPKFDEGGFEVDYNEPQPVELEQTYAAPV
tara:strand:+ start:17180 stop:17821 length:642 start_codon:yes stop_codon:yes gene_type:complete